MRILVSGGTGFIGSALLSRLRSMGHEVTVLTRAVNRVPPGIDAAVWDPASGMLQRGVMEGVDAVVHLAGAGIADARWRKPRRAAILNSRVDGTGLLFSAMDEAGARPGVFISASATGFYGDTGENVCDETARAGRGFAAEVCRVWEAEAIRAIHADTDCDTATANRTVILRFGTVLDPAGGALSRMVPLFRAGLGGRLGSGRQWMSCISRRDAVSVIAEALVNPTIQGPVNVVAPEPIRNRDFTRALATGLGKRLGPPVPGAALRLAFGHLADELLLGSSRVVPAALEDAGFAFRHPDVTQYLRDDMTV